MDAQPARFVWYELVTPDLDDAGRFYAHVVGWETADAGHPDLRYTRASAAGRPVAGMMALSEDMRAGGVPPHWLGYIGTEDVDAAAARVKAAGGAVLHGPQDVPGVGRFAVVRDPQGVVVGLFRMNATPPAPAPGAPGTAGWHELASTDGAAAWSFYSGQFGWTHASDMEMGQFGTYRMFGTGGADAAGGIMTRMDPSIPPHWLFYMNVDDIDAAAARVKDAGGEVVRGPMEVPGGLWVIHGRDPQGAYFALVGHRKAA